MLEVGKTHWAGFLWKRLVRAMCEWATRDRVSGCEEDSQAAENFEINRLQPGVRSNCKILPSESMKLSLDISIRSNHSTL